MVKFTMTMLDMDENSEYLETSNRRLENYLYVLGVDAVATYKKWDGYTVWRYKNTQELRDLIAKFNDVPARRARILGEAKEVM